MSPESKSETPSPDPRENRRRRVVEAFQRAGKKATAELNVLGMRKLEQKAWYSPQRDLINLMPSLLSEASCLASYLMPEKKQFDVKTLPMELLAVFCGPVGSPSGAEEAEQVKEGAVRLLPAVMHRAIDNDPESFTMFMACLGMATLLHQAMMPVFSVRPDGTVADFVEPPVILEALSMCMSERELKKIRKRCRDTGNILNEAACVQMIPALQRLAADLADDMKAYLEEEPPA